ncbi:radical SAM protein [Planomonospora sp. ID91781]|uniref:radical SAM protein n=1 Tax=Planomonospora sp. ID91781 TaxID=2738135 RepID=UPI001A1C6450|nr:radical SAM protein [Planomonospora sp. ID91781]MBG0826125.1 radical SAM protein [Planomonospora sp. ID91781]
MTIITQAIETPALLGWRLELEITGKCQLQCTHCYADSGPTIGHGTMTAADWHQLISGARSLAVSRIQFIGGEPTLHPAFSELLGHAAGTGCGVEVFSNLVSIRDEWWPLFQLPNVSLATSYYSDQAGEHAAVTRSANSHHLTRANIVRALTWRIPIRVGIIGLTDTQRTEDARAELIDLGVPRTQIKVDHVRGIGRASRLQPDVSQLCGHCGRGKAAIGPTGEVWPCVLSRWMMTGNVKEQPLPEIVSSDAWKAALATIPAPRRSRGCNPDSDGNDCSPAETYSDGD